MLESTQGFLLSLPLLWIVAIGLLAAATLGFHGAPLWLWTGVIALFLHSVAAPVWTWMLLAVFAFVFLLPPVRRALLSQPVMALLEKLNFLPQVSATEQVAIESGTVWIDGDLFSGRPHWRKLLHQPFAELSAEEQAFLDGPVEELCSSVDDWEIWRTRELPDHALAKIKEYGLFGLHIPKEYGGHGFSASANSAIVAKLTSRSTPLAITVMVPNSLGPAELLMHYGTEDQKRHYLPRLARGEEIPCFALTEPSAGSDAGAIQAQGVVFRDEDGELRVRLDWNKRYITLAAISTLLGLAFKLRDPDNLLGRGEDLGITCALIPTDTPGVVLGRRHDPLGVPFYNCPTEGHDVVVSVDQIIGGVDGAGGGWRMLMECLAAGRGISLPASATAGTKLVARVAGAYAVVRQQFGLSIGRFEGIEEALARIAGFAYLLDAMRKTTNGGLDQGAKPAVVTAIAKYNSTELFRQAINDGMDVLGGAAISRGPNNLLAHPYFAVPINITVEGANILTRTLMIFGQGAIRCHPYAYKEIKALTEKDPKAFDKALWGHVGHVVRNTTRAVLLSVSRGWLSLPPVTGPAARHYRRMSWAAASFATLADLAMAALGGDLKRKEKLTGRFSDVFSWLYLCNAALHRFESEGRRPEDRPLLDWCMEYGFARMQEGFDGLYANLNAPLVGWFLRGPVRLWSRMNPLSSGPRDALGSRAAHTLMNPGEQRDRLTANLFVPKDREVGLGRLEHAFELCAAADVLHTRVKRAVRSGKIPRGRPAAMVQAAREAGLLNDEEVAQIEAAEAARQEAIQVDCFTLAEYAETAAEPRVAPSEPVAPSSEEVAPKSR